MILFKPFRNKVEEIHRHNVKQLLAEFRDLIEYKRNIFEKYRMMTDLIGSIQEEVEKDVELNNEEEGISEDIGSTNADNIEEFNKWAQSQASKDLAKFKNLTSLCDMNELRLRISSLNQDQRRLFDDFTERMISPNIDEAPVYLFVAGEAGTGKSFVVKLLIEAVKIIKIKAGSELTKLPVL